MQPEGPQASPPSPSPKYDFILKDQPKAKKGFKLPTFGLPRRAAIGVLAVLGVFVVIILYSTVFGNKTTDTEHLVRAAARAQEIVRVTKQAETLAHNPDTQGLMATTEVSLSSQETQISAYLARAKVKTNLKSLSIYLDKNSDIDLQSAAQNNNLDSAYANYLKQSLSTYKIELQAATNGASPARLKLLKDAYQSTNTLLSAPQLANAGG